MSHQWQIVCALFCGEAYSSRSMLKQTRMRTHKHANAYASAPTCMHMHILSNTCLAQHLVLGSESRRHMGAVLRHRRLLGSQGCVHSTHLHPRRLFVSAVREPIHKKVPNTHAHGSVTPALQFASQGMYDTNTVDPWVLWQILFGPICPFG